MMPYKHDIFISYAHIDNQPLLEGERGWVDDLHKTLAVRVAQLFGQEPNIWRDPQLAGNDDFAENITLQLPDAALLVLVLTPRYVKSAWCKREFKAFCDACTISGGIAIGEKTRIFKVVKTLVDDKEAPAEMRPLMRKLLGYHFYSVDPDSGRIHEASPARLKELFLDRLDDLAFDIVKLLDRMTHPERPDANAGKPVIYVAESSHDLQVQQSALRRDLERRGYTVLPEQPLPLDADQLSSFVQGQLARAAISVHMVGARYGVIPEGSAVSLIETQVTLAQERGQPGNFVRLVWLPSPALEIPSPKTPSQQTSDKQNQDFINRLRQDGGWSADADLLETSFDSLKTALDERLEAIEQRLKPLPAAPSTAAAEPAHIYLICDESDRQAAQPLADFLYDQGFEVILPLFASAEPDPPKRLAEHQQNLKSCDAAVVFYGAAGEGFLRQSIRELHDCAPVRKLPFRAKAICVAPPLTSEKQGYRTREALLVDHASGLNPDKWLPFLNALKAAS